MVELAYMIYMRKHVLYYYVYALTNIRSGKVTIAKGMVDNGFEKCLCF